MEAEKLRHNSFEGFPNLKEDDIKLAPERLLDKERLVTDGADTAAIDTHSGAPVSVGDNESCDVLGNGQLIKRVLKKSKIAKRPRRGELVTISYTCKLSNGAIVERMENLEMHVGDFEVVEGLDIAMTLMYVGESAEVIIDSRFAYGSLGLKNSVNYELSIPPEATLTYEVHLIETKLEECSDLKSFEIRKKYGTRKKERANFWYNRSEYNIAIQLYKRALDYLDSRVGVPDSKHSKRDINLSNSQLQALLDDLLVVYNNLAMAQIKISAFDAALQSVENVLLYQPNNSKALYRKGKILEWKGNTKEAILLLQKAASFEPESSSLQQHLAHLMIKARLEDNNKKEMYEKVLGQSKKLEHKNKQPQKPQTVESYKFKLISYIMGSILIGVAGVAILRYKY